MSDRSEQCAICGSSLEDFFRSYPDAVCGECDARALSGDGQKARHAGEYEDFVQGARERYKEDGVLTLPPDNGDNPVFIDGKKCWRRYRFGGWVTMLDRHNCDTLREFYIETGFFL